MRAGLDSGSRPFLVRQATGRANIQVPLFSVQGDELFVKQLRIVKSPFWFSGVPLIASAAFALAQSQTTTSELTPTEKWVVARVTAGEIADLSQQFPAEEMRKLSAHFLETLLTGDFSGFKPHRNGVRITCAIINEPIDLTNASVSSPVALAQCEFQQSITFLRTRFAHAVLFDGSTFKGNANFKSMKAKDSAFFRRVVFEGPVDFSVADITGDFHADDAQFEGPVDFSATDITRTFVANGARFQNKEQTASFNGMKVGNNAFFEKAMFEGPVDFTAAETVGEFHADDAQFKNKEQTATFNSMKVGQHAFFTRALFEGPVDFRAAEIANVFEAGGAQFRSSKTEAILKAMKCGRAFFTGGIFAGPVSFADSSFLDLEISNLKLDTQPAPPLDLSRSSISRHLHIDHIWIRKLVAPYLHVGGPSDFTHIRVEDSVDLSYGDFIKLDLSDSVWPKGVKEFHIEGISYKYVSAASNEAESHKALLKLADQSAYTADAYTNLEAFFSRQGYSDDADEAFIAGRCRERDETLRGWHWLYSWFVYLLSAYGRRPWQAAAPCILCVGIGYFLFSPIKMEPRKADISQRYNRFWYSLGLFFPLVDLRVDKEWQPKAEHSHLLNYIPLHILLGWILVPVAVAALTGLIK